MDGIPHFIQGKWDFIIGFPPCTYMSKAGARWMFPGGKICDERLKKALAAKRLFLSIYYSDCEKIVIENPTPLKVLGLPSPQQIVQPYKFDPDRVHPYSKRTCLWLKNVKPLVETSPEAMPLCTYIPSNTGCFSRGKGGGKGIAHNSKIRSKTFIGIGAAMSEQWG